MFLLGVAGVGGRGEGAKPRPASARIGGFRV